MTAVTDPAAWFAARGWRVHAFQREVWSAYARGESGLIHAPTGSGKTLAAALGPMLAAEREAPGPQLLWITPMRALAADTTQGLAGVAAELGLSWRVESRTGDASSSLRARQRKALPELLVSTPESVSLLLSYADLIPQWRRLRAVVVDEWHELLGSKRGVQTELILARLRRLAPDLRIWGLSATLGNLEEALATLLGPGRSGRLVAGALTRRLEIETLIPQPVDRYPWAGHLGLPLLPRVVEQLERAASSLVFTNTRAQAERWFEALSMAAPEHAIALHHGSLDRAAREAVEQGLRAGALRAVVATSSLDLGVDFSPVEQVIQIGGPKGIARLLQRAGRSGHRPDGLSRLVCVPTHALELAEFAAAREAIEAGRIEPRRPRRLDLDVLAQHVVTLALTATLSPEALLDEVRETAAYADLGAADWQAVLDFVLRGGSALQAYPQFRRVVVNEGRLMVADATTARRHRMAVGTITADPMMRVAWLRGGSLGSVEESFIARLRPGDGFQFAGRRLTLVRVREMTAYVRAGGRSSVIPRWQGGKMPLSSELAEQLLDLLGRALGARAPAELAALQPLLQAQARGSALPRRGRCLVEWLHSREGEHLFLYPFAGRAVHEGLAALLAWRLSRQSPRSFTLSVNDYGLELLAPALPCPDETALRALLDPAGLSEQLLQSLNASELARRAFREIARVAGLVFEGYPGAAKSMRQVQASSGLIFDVLERYDPAHPLLRQARDQALEQQLEHRRLHALLSRLHAEPLDLHRIERLTPLSFPLWAERISSQLSSEDLGTRIRRMVDTLERAPAARRSA
ncbi:MAG TPA: ligase-associated DNA damage response DEXH box helicase [Nevskiaceae bacterium]|nr:ligase-associated DNA damage response DEXH box helicase [Nevskiaceae bacterium]